MTNPERSLSSALLVLPQRTSWHSLNLAKLRELGIAQSADREGNDIVELFWRFIGQIFFFLSMDFFIFSASKNDSSTGSLLLAPFFSVGLFSLIGCWHYFNLLSEPQVRGSFSSPASHDMVMPKM